MQVGVGPHPGVERLGAQTCTSGLAAQSRSNAQACESSKEGGREIACKCAGMQVQGGLELEAPLEG